ncbi:uncharacterized protein LOC128270743 [Anopheles cruzii]|uniref:uncharacterized protein LOC128270743 n=1 Tax=Anopheles cruzii TaxID=68878 RepID=UPI0022EC3615|nr:uncharacterized protein LOC128270743 [Anopheles cruzii]
MSSALQTNKSLFVVVVASAQPVTCGNGHYPLKNTRGTVPARSAQICSLRRLPVATGVERHATIMRNRLLRAPEHEMINIVAARPTTTTKPSGSILITVGAQQSGQT